MSETPERQYYDCRTALVTLLKNQDTGYIPITTPYQALDLQPEIQNSLRILNDFIST